MKAIRRSHIEAWVKAMDATLAASTVKTRFKNVRSVFRAANRDRVIASDPCEGVVLPRTRRAEAAMQIPTLEQVGQILDAADEWFRPFIGLCAFAGLRLGEATAVKVDDIDFLRRTLTVSRQAQRAPRRKGEVDIRPPKYGSERVVFLPEGLVAMLATHVERDGVRSGGWLFVGAGDGPPYQNTLGHWWRRVQRDAVLSGIRLHDLRHFYASGFIAQGCDVVRVQRALGHASASTTLNTYSHLWPTAEDRTRKAAPALMASAVAASADPVRTAGECRGLDHV